MTRRARDKRARDISTIDSAKLNVAPPPFPRFNEASNPFSAPPVNGAEASLLSKPGRIFPIRAASFLPSLLSGTCTRPTGYFERVMNSTLGQKRALRVVKEAVLIGAFRWRENRFIIGGDLSQRRYILTKIFCSRYHCVTTNIYIYMRISRVW